MVPKKKISRRENRKKNSPSKKRKSLFLRWGLLGILIAIFICAIFQINESKIIWSGGKFNFVIGSDDGAVMFGSFDAVEKQVTSISFPQDLYIKSRSVGEYKVGRLYSLSLYEDEPGKFLQRKVSGFLRVPISGYVMTNSEGDTSSKKLTTKSVIETVFGRESRSNMNLLDMLIILFRGNSYVWYDQSVDDLIREGVFVNRSGGGYGYDSSRTQEYVEGRFFDWNVAQEGLSVAVINASSERGLASDVSDFVNNIGADVVMVREGEDEGLNSRLVISRAELIGSETVGNLRDLLGISSVTVGDTSEFRSDVVFYVGSDMMAIF